MAPWRQSGQIAGLSLEARPTVKLKMCQVKTTGRFDKPKRRTKNKNIKWPTVENCRLAASTKIPQSITLLINKKGSGVIYIKKVLS